MARSKKHPSPMLLEDVKQLVLSAASGFYESDDEDDQRDLEDLKDEIDTAASTEDLADAVMSLGLNEAEATRFVLDAIIV